MQQTRSQGSSQAAFNRCWAEVLLETLTRHGIHHVCIAPGSRSAPLALAAAANQKLVCHTHFDERGLGFLALGLAKSTRQAVAIIVTSGTAVANLHPAVVEAQLTGEKLVIISADRPPELIHCGANQATEQPGLFASHLAGSLNLPRPTAEIPARWLVSALDTLLANPRHGPVHINCPFAEPLYAEQSDDFPGWQQALGDWWQSRDPWLHYAHSVNIPTEADWLFWRQKRGVVIAGRMTPAEGVLVGQWAAELGWPLLGDVIAQCGQPLPAAALWLAHPDAQRALDAAQIVLQFGSSLTGKNLLGYQANCRAQSYWHVDPLPGQRNPACPRGRRMEVQIDRWLQHHPAQPRQPWCPQLDALAQRTRRYLHQHLHHFGEAQLAHRLCELLPEKGALFLGNSLSIRLVDAFASLPAGYPVYCNRGASGIDGLLATAAGTQRGNGQPLLVLLGDLSTLYDLNSLALLQHAPAPVVILVVNNQGGQIFSLLPTPPAQRASLFALPPQADFSHAAALFGLQFRRVASWLALQQAVQQGFNGGVTLVEVVVNGDDGAQTLACCAREVVTL